MTSFWMTPPPCRRRRLRRRHRRAFGALAACCSAAVSSAWAVLAAAPADAAPAAPSAAVRPPRDVEGPTDPDYENPPPPPPPPPAPAPPPPLLSTDALTRFLQLRQWAEEFAPEVRLHPDDEFRPSSVEWYLPRVSMGYVVAGLAPFGILGKGQVNTFSIASQGFSVWPFGSSLSGGGGQSSFRLDIPGDWQEAETRRGSLASAAAYVHTLDYDAVRLRFPWMGLPVTPYVDFQYWFFYPYNGDITSVLNIAHEGDWEHVTVRVDQWKRLVKVYYASHDGEGRWRDAASVPRSAEGRPVAYSALRTHASYPTAGTQSRSWIEKPDDHTADGGPTWRTWNSLVFIDGQSPNWMRYNGRWGELGIFSWTSGPYGPAFQGAWNGDL